MDVTSIFLHLAPFIKQIYLHTHREILTFVFIAHFNHLINRSSQ